MKLREEDRKRLISWGYALEDIPQIEKASRRDKTIYTMGGSPISREEAVNVLGW